MSGVKTVWAQYCGLLLYYSELLFEGMRVKKAQYQKCLVQIPVYDTCSSSTYSCFHIFI